MDFNLAEVQQKSLKLLEERLKLKQNVTAHDTSHLLQVAKISQLIGKLYNFNDRELFLVYFASLFHDIVRSPAQDKQLQDEALSAQEAVKLLEENFPETIGDERYVVKYAIENHGDFPNWMADPTTRNLDPRDLKEKIRFALFVADKIEQNGVRVIARRSSFVGGERLSDKGDLRGFGFIPQQDEALTTSIETLIRLTFINPEYIYPEKLKNLLKPLYRDQREFLYGLFKVLNLTLEKIIKILLETKRADGKNLLTVRNIDINDPDKLKALIESQGQITSQAVESTDEDLARSAMEAVTYFSINYEKDLDKLIINWKPINNIVKKWQRKMVEYLNGTWLNSVESKLNV